VNDVIEQLISVVAEEAEHCERILMQLRQQQDCLVHGDVERLQDNLREQEHSLRRSRELENRRRTLAQQVAQSADIHGQDSSMSSLIAAVSDDYGRRLAELRVSMAAAIERVNKTKEQNRMLIERSLSNINEVIHLLAATNATVTDYSGSARGAHDAAALSVDRHC
jgi:alanyl-tRNA synthetase